MKYKFRIGDAVRIIATGTIGYVDGRDAPIRYSDGRKLASYSLRFTDEDVDDYNAWYTDDELEHAKAADVVYGSKPAARWHNYRVQVRCPVADMMPDGVARNAGWHDINYSGAAFVVCCKPELFGKLLDYVAASIIFTWEDFSAWDIRVKREPSLRFAEFIPWHFDGERFVRDLHYKED